MRALLWKDYRLNRSLLILQAALLILIYVIGIVTQIVAVWPNKPTANDWAGTLVSYGSLTMYLTFCFTGLLGGHAIACERGDRSAHFLACLPPTRMQILASKLIIAASVVSLFQGEIGKYAVLAVLMPIVAGMGGNAGTQTLAVAVRALATNQLTESNTIRAFGRELTIALANGLSLGVLGLTAYRPFPFQAVRDALAGADRVVVLERALATVRLEGFESRPATQLSSRSATPRPCPHVSNRSESPRTWNSPMYHERSHCFGLRRISRR